MSKNNLCEKLKKDVDDIKHDINKYERLLDDVVSYRLSSKQGNCKTMSKRQATFSRAAAASRLAERVLKESDAVPMIVSRTGNGRHITQKQVIQKGNTQVELKVRTKAPVGPVDRKRTQSFPQVSFAKEPERAKRKPEPRKVVVNERTKDSSWKDVYKKPSVPLNNKVKTTTGNVRATALKPTIVSKSRKQQNISEEEEVVRPERFTTTASETETDLESSRRSLCQDDDSRPPTPTVPTHTKSSASWVSSRGSERRFPDSKPVSGTSLRSKASDRHSENCMSEAGEHPLKPVSSVSTLSALQVLVEHLHKAAKKSACDVSFIQIIQNMDEMVQSMLKTKAKTRSTQVSPVRRTAEVTQTELSTKLSDQFEGLYNQLQEETESLRRDLDQLQSAYRDKCNELECKTKRLEETEQNILEMLQKEEGLSCKLEEALADIEALRKAEEEYCRSRQEAGTDMANLKASEEQLRMALNETLAELVHQRDETAMLRLEKERNHVIFETKGCETEKLQEEIRRLQQFINNQLREISLPKRQSKEVCDQQKPGNLPSQAVNQEPVCREGQINNEVGQMQKQSVDPRYQSPQNVPIVPHQPTGRDDLTRSNYTQDQSNCSPASTRETNVVRPREEPFVAPSQDLRNVSRPGTAQRQEDTSDAYTGYESTKYQSLSELEGRVAAQQIRQHQQSDNVGLQCNVGQETYSGPHTPPPRPMSPVQLERSASRIPFSNQTFPKSPPGASGDGHISRIPVPATNRRDFEGVPRPQNSEVGSFSNALKMQTNKNMQVPVQMTKTKNENAMAPADINVSLVMPPGMSMRSMSSGQPRTTEIKTTLPSQSVREVNLIIPTFTNERTPPERYVGVNTPRTSSPHEAQGPFPPRLNTEGLSSINNSSEGSDTRGRVDNHDWSMVERSIREFNNMAASVDNLGRVRQEMQHRQAGQYVISASRPNMQMHDQRDVNTTPNLELTYQSSNDPGPDELPTFTASHVSSVSFSPNCSN